MSEEFDYEAYERACKKREKENEAYLDEFDEWLKASGLSESTICRHLDNVEFFLNTFLLREDAYGMEEGCYRIDDYLGYFFIRKCMWSTPKTIKENIASFKKFYKCMLEKGHIAKESYDLLLRTIKEQKDVWIADCEAFNDPGVDYFGDFDMFGSGGAGDPYVAVADVIREAMRNLGDGYVPKASLPLNEEAARMFGPGDVGLEDLPTKEEAIVMLTVAVLYLTAWEESSAYGPQLRAWKAADQAALEMLRERGFLQFANTDTTVVFTPEGCDFARVALMGFGLDYLVGADEPVGVVAAGQARAQESDGPKLKFVD